MEPITIEFTLQKDEIAQAVRAYNLKRNPYIWWIFLAAYLPLSILSIWLMLIHPSPALNALLVFILLVFPGIVFVRIDSGARQLAGQLLSTLIRWEISLEGITITSSSVDVLLASEHLDWQTFERALVSPQYYFLVQKHSRGSYRFLPRRAFSQPDEEERFRGFLQENLGEFQDTRVGFQYTLSVWVIFLLYLLNLGLLIYGYHYGIFR
jgi:hypothetical protein